MGGGPARIATANEPTEKKSEREFPLRVIARLASRGRSIDPSVQREMPIIFERENEAMNELICASV